MRFIPFPSIGQLHNASYIIKHHARYTGEQKDGKPVYNHTKELPTVKFNGTVKLHGTSASVCYDGENIWYQSRKSILTPGKATDNAGFAFFCTEREPYFNAMMRALIKYHGIDTTKYDVCLFGEWCGGSIQKKVAITGLPKMFVIFSVGLVAKDYVQPEGEKFQITEWLDIPLFLSNHESRIYNINEFETFTAHVDFEHIASSNNLLVKMTTDVELNCPVAKALCSISECTTGEGIVWTGDYNGQHIIFKVKGDKHAGSKVKLLNEMDEDAESLKRKFANEACTSSRLNQAVQESFDTLNSGVPNIKGTGDVVRWVMNDIIKEESERMQELGLTMKAIGNPVALIVRRWFFEELKNSEFNKE